MTLSVLISVLFSTFTISATYQTILGDMTSVLFCAGILLLTGIGLLMIYYYLTIWFLQSASSVTLTGSGYSYAWIPYMAAFICLLCWLPYFLYEYPGVMTPDSINQYAQIIGAYQLSNHHSIVHTALIGMFYNIGLSLTGNLHTGLALYTIAQMVFYGTFCWICRSDVAKSRCYHARSTSDNRLLCIDALQWRVCCHHPGKISPLQAA